MYLHINTLTPIPMYGIEHIAVHVYITHTYIYRQTDTQTLEQPRRKKERRRKLGFPGISSSN